MNKDIYNKISKRKFIDGKKYLCGIGTGNGIERYEVGTCEIGNRTWFSFPNGDYCNSELPYKYPQGCNSYRVHTAKIIPNQ